MKKNFIKNVADLTNVKKAIKNALTEEGEELKNALLGLIEELEGSEVEIDKEAFAEEIKSILEEQVGEKVAEEVANQIAKKMQTIQNSLNSKTELSVKVKNEIAGAILRTTDRQEVENAVNAVLVKNDITGLTFTDVVDFAIADNWGDANPLFNALKRTPFNKFFYNEDDLAVAAVLAKQWDSANAENIDKTVQEIVATGKEISTEYVYKRQRASMKDLVNIEKAGQTANFLKWINEELDRQIVNTIVKAILVGDAVNPVGSRLTKFESILTKEEDDAFTSIVEGDLTLQSVRKVCDKVYNPYGKAKWLVISSTDLSTISEFIYAEGGTIDYIALDALKGKLGVSDIFVTDIATAPVCLLPEGYWYVEDDAISVAYPTYEKNTMNYQKERLVGGAIHDLKSTAFLKLGE